MICTTKQDIEGMIKAGEVVRDALLYAETLIRPNVSTLEIDKKLEKFITNKGAIPSFLNYEGYPNSICASVNEMVVHGIPSDDIILKEGDIISIDIVQYLMVTTVMLQEHLQLVKLAKKNNN